MMLERTYEYRLYPTAAQQKNFEQIADTVRALHNRMLSERTQHFRKTGTWKRLNPEPFVKESLLIQDLEPSIVNWAVSNLEKAYINFFRIQRAKMERYQLESLQKVKEDPSYKLMDTDLIGYPKIKKKTTKESWSIGTAHVLVTPGRVLVPGVGNIKFKLHRPIPQNAKVRYYTLLKKPSGHFFLLVHLQIQEPAEKLQQENALGIAFEPQKLVCCSDGRPVMFWHQSQARQKRIARAYEDLKRKTPGSRRYEKQRLYLASLYEKQTNQRKDSLHKISRDLVAKTDFIVIEEPQVLRKKKRLISEGAFEAVMDEAWWTFSEQLRYKTKEEGKHFWRVSGAVPVRAACSICGVIAEKSRRQGQWICPFCGADMPASMNAARNLERLGNQYIEDLNSLNRQQ